MKLYKIILAASLLQATVIQSGFAADNPAGSQQELAGQATSPNLSEPYLGSKVASKKAADPCQKKLEDFHQLIILSKSANDKFEDMGSTLKTMEESRVAWCEFSKKQGAALARNAGMSFGGNEGSNEHFKQSWKLLTGAKEKAYFELCDALATYDKFKPHERLSEIYKCKEASAKGKIAHWNNNHYTGSGSYTFKDTSMHRHLVVLRSRLRHYEKERPRYGGPSFIEKMRMFCSPTRTPNPKACK